MVQKQQNFTTINKYHVSILANVYKCSVCVAHKLIVHFAIFIVHVFDGL